MNTQFAIQGDDIYVLEVNPRASRTVPFVSKATGISLARVAVNCMVGKSLAEQNVTKAKKTEYFSVKESVFPFIKFPGVDILLGPEMKSTGEVMGLDNDFGHAFAKSQLGGGTKVPVSGRVFISVRDRDKPAMIELARRLSDLGFGVVATQGTARFLTEAGINAETINKV